MRLTPPRFQGIGAGLGLAVLVCQTGCVDQIGFDTPPAFQPDPVVRTSTLITGADKTWETIGLSIRGKPIHATTVGSGPKKLYIVGGIHGDEPEGPEVAAALPAAFGEMPGLGEWTVRIVRDVNPDGSGLGKKPNTRGVDLNRNWPTKNFRPMPPYAKRPLSELESIALQKDLDRFKPDVVMVFHSSHQGPFVHGSGKDPKLAIKFGGGARQIDAGWSAKPELRYDTPGSLSRYIAEKKGMSVLTVEFGRMKDASTNAAAIRAGVLAAFGDAQASEAVAAKVAQNSTPAKPTAAKAARLTESGK